MDNTNIDNIDNETIEINENCTKYFSHIPSKNKSYIYQKWWFWVIIFIIAINIIYNSRNDDKTNIGDSYVTIENFRITENYGDPVIIVSFSFTNYDDEAKSFIYSTSSKAYQNGVELNSPFAIDSESEHDFKKSSSEILPGKTLVVEEMYQLNDLISNVTITVTDFLNMGSEKISKTFEIKEEAEKVLGNKENEGSLGKVHVSIDRYRIVESYDEKLIIVKFIFTNNGEEATSFNSALNYDAYQSGIELDTPLLIHSCANFSPQNKTLKIQPGSTIDVEVAFVLRNNSDEVLIELSNYGYKKITKTFNIN